MIDLNKIAKEKPMIMTIINQHLDEAKRLHLERVGLPDNYILIGELSLGMLLASAVAAGIELQKGADEPA